MLDAFLIIEVSAEVIMLLRCGEFLSLPQKAIIDTPFGCQVYEENEDYCL